MKKLDKTKENLKVDAMSAGSRKELFHKFVEAGGKITVDENNELLKKSSNTKIITDKDKQTAIKNKYDAKKNVRPDSHSVKTVHKNKDLVKYKPGFLETLSNKILIKLRLYFLHVTDFSSSYFNVKFLHLFSSEYKTALMGMRLIYLEIFEQNQDLSTHIRYKLERINPVNLRLIDEISEIYNAGEIEKITEGYIKSPEAIQQIEAIREPLISIFRKIYLLKPYEHNIFNVLEKALEYYILTTKKKSSEFSLKRKNLKNDIYIIFEKLFPQLYWLFCRYNNKIISLGSTEIEAILKTKSAKKGRNIEINKTETNADIETKETNGKQIPEKETAPLSDDEKAVLDILNHYTPSNIKGLRLLYDKSNLFSNVENNDKMLYIYLIFMEFDIEYSFLFTTNKIKFKFDYMESGYINFKEKFLDLYDNIKNNMDLLKEYSNSLDILFKVKSEKPFTNERYIAYAKEISTLEQRRLRAAGSAKLSILNFMTEVSTILRSLINDIKGQNKIIDNPNDIFSFEIADDANKKLNHKTIASSLYSAYCFAGAFMYKLSKGDLMGELEFKESEKEKSQKEKNEALPPKINSGDTASKGSIMDEIDKIIET